MQTSTTLAAERSNPGEWDDAFATELDGEDECVVFRCFLCRKTRAVFGLLSREVCNVVDARCSDYGRKCESDVDPIPKHAMIFESADQDQLLPLPLLMGRISLGINRKFHIK